MPHRYLAALVVVLTATSFAQDTPSTDSPTVWGSVAVINHGERTPLRGGRQSVLTPRGAQQMNRQGAAFRARYIGEGDDDGQNENAANISAPHPIFGLEGRAVDNAQLSVLTTSDNHVVAGAQAFMQGLYPPDEGAFLDSAGGMNMSHDTATDNSTEYPLNGYQYAAVRPRSSSEEAALPLQGHVGCNTWLAGLDDIFDDPTMQSVYRGSQESYDLFFSRPPFEGMLPNESVNFWNAYDLWDFARYQIAHNQTVYDAMQERAFPTSSLDNLERNALRQQLAMNTDARISGLDSSDDLRPIAGRTLARGVLSAVEDLVSARSSPFPASSSPSLTLMFTSLQPFLAFFSLTRLRTAETRTADPFYGLPDPAAAMAFELVGDQPGQYGSFPEEEHLWVRFVYRQNSGSAEGDDGDADQPSFQAHTLFSSSRSEYVMPLFYFRQEMRKIALDIGTWCDVCASPQLYCVARRALSGDGSSAPELGGSASGSDGGAGGAKDPVVAGIIGAVIMFALMALAAGAAALLGGVRIHRVSRRGGGSGGRAWGLGGFKGGEKMASDADLTLSKGGAGHARVGSWELRGGQDGVGDAPLAGGTNVNESGSANERIGAGLTVHKKPVETQTKPVVDDDGASVLSADIVTAPVRPRESL